MECLPGKEDGDGVVARDATAYSPAMSCCAVHSVECMLEGLHAGRFEEKLCNVCSQLEYVDGDVAVGVIPCAHSGAYHWRKCPLPDVGCTVPVEENAAERVCAGVRRAEPRRSVGE